MTSGDPGNRTDNDKKVDGIEPVEEGIEAAPPTRKMMAMPQMPVDATTASGARDPFEDSDTGGSVQYRPVLLQKSDSGSAGFYVIDGTETVLGRDLRCSLTLPDLLVSRRHARILWDNHGAPGEKPVCRIEDMRSHNGTFVNGRRIGESILASGDRIRLANSVIYYYVKDTRELEAQQRLRNLATTDALTGLLNRPMFEEQARTVLATAARYRRPACLAVADIDHFKRINDGRGHIAGDAVLRHIAKLLTGGLRGVDLVGRIGGEEFAILMPETPLNSATISANRLREAVAQQPTTFEDTSINHTISIGVAEIGEGMDGWRELYRLADHFLYVAKRSGRNRVVGGTNKDARDIGRIDTDSPELRPESGSDIHS